MGIGIIVNSNYIRTNLSGLIQEVKLKEKPYSVSSNKYYIYQYIRESYWVGHSLLKELYINGLF